MRVAILRLLQIGAGVATKLGVSSDSAATRLRTCTARLCAGVVYAISLPGSEFSYLAVNWAWQVVHTCLRKVQNPTGFAATAWWFGYGSCSRLRAFSARQGALGPFTPFGYLAVHGAQLSVTLTSVCQGATAQSTVLRTSSNAAFAGLDATTAGVRANHRMPGIPFRHNAVDCAVRKVALLDFVDCRARPATVGGCNFDASGTSLGTGTAGHGARSPISEYGDLAVNSTVLSVAV